jgi:hypothetical protein
MRFPARFYCAAIAAGGGAKRCSIARRTRKASVSGTATWAQRDLVAWIS